MFQHVLKHAFIWPIFTITAPQVLLQVYQDTLDPPDVGDILYTQNGILNAYDRHACLDICLLLFLVTAVISI